MPTESFNHRYDEAKGAYYITMCSLTGQHQIFKSLISYEDAIRLGNEQLGERASDAATANMFGKFRQHNKNMEMKRFLKNER